MPYQAPEQTQQFDEVTRKVQIPNAKVGLVIGKGGETIKQLQYQSRARIQVTRDQDTAPGASYREIEVVGTPDAIAKAEQLINDIVNDVGGPGRALAAPGPDSVVIKVPNDKVGLIIGKGGETIKSMQTRSGARIQVQSDAELEPGATERTVTLSGNPQATAEAERAIKEVISGDRPPRRFDGPPGGGGYGGRGGYRSGPPSGQWGGPQGGYRPPSGPPSYGGYPAPAPAPAPYYGAPPAYAPQQAYPGYDQSGYGYAPPAYGAAPAASGAAPAYDYTAYQQPAAAPAAAGQYDYSQQYAQGYGQQGYYQAPADPASQGYYQQPAADGSAAAPAAGYDYSQGGAPAAAPTQ
jgi:far upstream element-binding protein